MRQIVASISIAANVQALITEHHLPFEVIVLDRDGTSTSPIENAEVFFAGYEGVHSQYLETVLKRMVNLKWMHTNSAGVDTFWPQFVEFASSNAVLTNSSGVMSLPIAEYVIGQIFAIAKGFPQYLHAQDRHEWLRQQSITFGGRDIERARLLILGLGAIGRDTARLAQPLGMHVWGVRRGMPDSDPPAYAERVLSIQDNWQDLLSEADYVVISLPLTDGTRGLIDKDFLNRMNSQAWFINIARGALIDENALLEALQNNTIGGAVLDVTALEPLPSDHPLWSCSNVLITPHISWRSPQVIQRSILLMLENLQRFINGETLLNVVPRETGY
jgi:phosphoglycerate dehydrogenase-like enzyme